MMLQITGAEREDSVWGADLDKRVPFAGAANGCAKEPSIGGKARTPQPSKIFSGTLPGISVRKVTDFARNLLGADRKLLESGGARESSFGGRRAG